MNELGFVVHAQFLVNRSEVITNSSLLDNSGTFNNSGLVSSGTGTLNNQAAGTINNSGSIRISSPVALPPFPVATLANAGVINNQNGATIESFSGGKIDNSGTISNAVGAQINNDADSLVVNSGSLANDGQMLNAGTVMVSGAINGNGTYTQTGGLTKLQGGSITQSYIDVQGGALLGAGSLTGPVNVASGATLGPGDPNLMTIDGSLTVNGGTLIFQIAGTGASEFDVLSVNGTAYLDGVLNVSLFGSGSSLFSPHAGDSFDILTADVLQGSFATLNYAALLDPSLRWHIDYLTDAIGTTDVLRLSVVSAVPVPAAIWLFGSGLLGLVGIARHRNAWSPGRRRKNRTRVYRNSGSK